MGPIRAVAGMDPLGWDSPMFRVYERFELVERKRRDGSVELGYPRAWTTATSVEYPPDLELEPDLIPPIKDLVRELVGHRCIRCGHPYRVGQESLWSEPARPETVQETAALALFDAEPTDEPRVKRERPIHWSPCDEHCTHAGPMRWHIGRGDGWGLADGPGIGELRRDLASYGRRDPAIQAAWRILTVHHFNENKADCRWWNLGALCQRCHLTVQGKVQMDRVWPHEHSDWFKPYVAGFYAWRYEGREITRAEALTRMDELLAYERQDRSTGR